MTDETLIPTTGIPTALAAITTGSIPNYRRIADVQRSGLWPTTKVGGRLHVKQSDLPAVAEALGLTLQSGITAPPGTAVATRSEKRGGISALRVVGMDSHDRLTDAVNAWARYTGPDNVGPSQGSGVYFQSFKRMIHSALGLNQSSKRDAMSQIELMLLSVLESDTALLLLDLMARNETRGAIKLAYSKRIKELGAVHRVGIQISLAGFAAPTDGVVA